MASSYKTSEGVTMRIPRDFSQRINFTVVKFNRRRMLKTLASQKRGEIPNVEIDFVETQKASKCDEIPNVEIDLLKHKKPVNVMEFQMWE